MEGLTLFISPFWVFLGLLILWWLLSNELRLRGIPGSILARQTDLWRFWKTSQGDMHHVYIDLHRKYGPLVRIGPNCVSFAGLEALSAIYNVSQKFSKVSCRQTSLGENIQNESDTNFESQSDFYTTFQAVIAGRPYANLFNTTDDEFHTAIKKPVSRAYAMSTLIEFEPFIDSTTEVFLTKIEEQYTCSLPDNTPPMCDLGRWLQYYAFDVIGEITFSKRFGFLDAGGDVDGILASFKRADRAAAWGQLPWVDHYIFKPLARWRFKPPTSSVVAFTRDRIREITQSPEDDKSPDRRDMLSRFLDAQRAQPQFLDNLRVLSYATSNVNAGANTTAITLRAAIYYLLKNASTMKKLEDEILATASDGPRSSPCVPWAATQKMPYLDAVIKEALRIHPAVGMILERVVPEEGLKVYGTFIPKGTRVGISPWVIHRDRSIFGKDADEWRPDRWLNCDEAQLKKMTRASFAFGGGTRTCIGKNISLLEIYKLLAALIQKFEISLADADREWRTTNNFLVYQQGLEVRFRLRDSGSIKNQ